MVKKKSKYHVKSSTKMFITLAAALVLAGTTTYILQARDDLVTDKDSIGQSSDINRDTDYVNLSPPTEQDAEDVEVNKEKIGDEAKDTQTLPSTGNAIVVVSFAGQFESSVEVSSFVQNIFEEGGECTLLLEKNDLKVTKTQLGQVDAKNTVCPTFYIPVSELESGEYTVSVSYKSSDYSGTSNMTKLRIEK
jgi:hypothetical protein